MESEMRGESIEEAEEKGDEEREERGERTVSVRDTGIFLLLLRMA